MPSPSFFVRQAQPNDAPALAAFARQTFIDTYSAHNTPEDMAQYLGAHFSEEQLLAELQDEKVTYLLANDPDLPAPHDLVGYAKLFAGAAEPCVRGRHPVEMSRIYVAKALIGDGYGTALLQASLNHAREAGHGVLWLGVWERNPRAIGFYKHMGFEEVGEHEFVLGQDVQRDLVLQMTL